MTDLKIKSGYTYAGIKGFNIIDHRIRAKLGLTCEEYIVLQFILLAKANKETITNDLLWTKLGMTEVTYTTVIRLLERQSKSLDEALAIFEKEFEAKIPESDFDEFWEIFKKHGNKTSTKEKYFKVRVKTDKQHLHKRAKQYIDWVIKNRKDLQYCKAAEVWLNPKLAHWDDILPGEEVDEKQMQSSIFKKKP